MGLNGRPAMTILAVTAAVVFGAAVPAGADPIAVQSLVDDGAYPGAAQILAEQNVELLAGDGHILLVDCATAPTGDIGVLKVYTTDGTIGADGIGRVCFKVTAAAGWLSLRVPGVYEIRGDGQRTGTGHEVTAELESEEGAQITVDVDPDGSTQVGLGADPDASPTMLLQLRAGDGLAPVTGAKAAIGRIEVAGRACTATLVSAEWVLTAAGCFADNPDQPIVVSGPPAHESLAVFSGHATVAITALASRGDRDVVLARLATPITDITPARVAATAPGVGSAAQAIGYSRTAAQWASDAQHTAALTVHGLTAVTVSLTATNGRLCKGDAGAPVFNAGGEIQAVSTRSGMAGCQTAPQGSADVVASRVDDLVRWVGASTWTGFHSRQDVWYTDGWNSGQAKYVAGDFNGDGTTDLAAFFDYGSSSTGLWTWTRNSSGGYDHVKLWQTPAGQLTQPAMTPLTGDFNHDGKTDITAFYDLIPWNTKLLEWTGKGNGQFNERQDVWYTDGWNSGQAKYVAGDFNGDGTTDLAAFFDYGSSSTGLWTWTRNSSGGYDHVKLWQTPAGQLTQPAMTPLTGDFNHDGKTDITAFYDLIPWNTKLLEWTSNGAGML